MEDRYDQHFFDIFDRLRGVETSIASFRAESQAEHKAMMDLVTDHHSRLHGDGSEASPGIVTRMDRLEQTQKAQAWNMRAIWSACLAAIANAVWGLLGVGK